MQILRNAMSLERCFWDLSLLSWLCYLQAESLCQVHLVQMIAAAKGPFLLEEKLEFHLWHDLQNISNAYST